MVTFSGISFQLIIHIIAALGLLDILVNLILILVQKIIFLVPTQQYLIQLIILLIMNTHRGMIERRSPLITILSRLIFPVDIGSFSNGILSDYKGMLPSSCNFYPSSGIVGNISNSINFISGQSGLHRVNPISNTINLSSINIIDNGVNRGMLPGCLFINTSDPGFFNCTINTMSDNTSLKKFFYFISQVNAGTSTLNLVNQSILFSLDYNDWKNYNDN